MRSIIAHPLLAACLIALGACAGKYDHKLQFNPSEPIRVAVLPFYQVNGKGEIIEADPDMLIDNVTLVSDKLKDTPARFARKAVRAELANTSLDLVNQNLVDSELVHHGFAKEDLTFDLPKIISASPREICSHLLNCDAVLYGRITEWDRNYYGLQSTSEVGIELKLVSAHEGQKVLFEAKAEDSDSRGLTKVPTGYYSLVVEPIRGLDNQILVDLATATIKKMLAPLNVTTRPEFLKSSPPSIYASAHDAGDGSLQRGKHLTVLMVGSPKREASFSIGSAIENVPMAEHESGHYIGEYHPLSSDRFENVPIYVTLTDQFGRSTRQKLGRSSVTLR